ncbi:MAG: hypothetical protein US89_C0001G0048 [Candidatus Peregrinibacteria bacterium GW2011_GWF2_38_29]|nr:MAG: hypothetical protein US89_C0001G0048 [Candidatus Peregrinibacteria bacterium GW2011_GWF2_38_29]
MPLKITFKIAMQTCKNCSIQFEITPQDLDFYSKMQVPEPTFCPSCRQQRRLAWRNERKLYKRKCSGTGKEIICIYPEDTSFPVYDHEYFFSDKWSALSYGRDFDFNRTFFDQFSDLLKVVPRILNYSFANENAEYGNLASWNKNCYMCFEADNNRDCFYSYYTYRSVDLIDCNYAVECELCNDCVDIFKCYNLGFSQDCKNCSDSKFLKNCTGCKSCFGCINLINKEFHFLNEKYSKEEYLEKIKSAKDFSIEDFSEFVKKFPHKFINGDNNENCTGNYLNHCQNSTFCFDSSNLRDCKFVFNCEKIKDGYDIDTYGGIEGAELVYECHSVGRGSFNVAFGNNVYQGLTNAFYCDNCANSKDIFGCISMHHAKFCILNKQYSEEEYKKLREKIVNHMRKTGEYGEFFPASISPFNGDGGNFNSIKSIFI